MFSSISWSAVNMRHISFEPTIISAVLKMCATIWCANVKRNRLAKRMGITVKISSTLFVRFVILSLSPLRSVESGRHRHQLLP